MCAGAIAVRVKTEVVRFESRADAPEHGVDLDESTVAVQADAPGESAEACRVRIEVQVQSVRPLVIALWGELQPRDGRCGTIHSTA
jgi:hypothetical protein